VARIIVEVMLKPEIHDPQGEAIAGACRRLGFGQVTGVRQGKRFEVEIDGPADEDAVTALTQLARDLLSNPVIEEFTVHVHAGEVSAPSTGNHSNREGSWQEGEISS
jgi:phosphoribosylformylglycinamidine synthase subunit PurS